MSAFTTQFEQIEAEFHDLMERIKASEAANKPLNRAGWDGLLNAVNPLVHRLRYSHADEWGKFVIERYAELLKLPSLETSDV